MNTSFVILENRSFEPLCILCSLFAFFFFLQWNYSKYDLLTTWPVENNIMIFHCLNPDWYVYTTQNWKDCIKYNIPETAIELCVGLELQVGYPSETHNTN